MRVSLFPLIPQTPCGSGLGPFCRCLRLGTAGGTSFPPRLPAGQKTVIIAANVGAIVPLRRSCRAAAPSRRAARLPRVAPGAVPHLLRARGAAQPAWCCSAHLVLLDSPAALLDSNHRSCISPQVYIILLARAVAGHVGWWDSRQVWELKEHNGRSGTGGQGAARG